MAADGLFSEMPSPFSSVILKYGHWRAAKLEEKAGCLRVAPFPCGASIPPRPDPTGAGVARGSPSLLSGSSGARRALSHTAVLASAEWAETHFGFPLGMGETQGLQKPRTSSRACAPGLRRTAGLRSVKTNNAGHPNQLPIVNATD